MQLLSPSTKKVAFYNFQINSCHKQKLHSYGFWVHFEERTHACCRVVFAEVRFTQRPGEPEIIDGLLSAAILIALSNYELPAVCNRVFLSGEDPTRSSLHLLPMRAFASMLFSNSPFCSFLVLALRCAILRGLFAPCHLQILRSLLLPFVLLLVKCDSCVLVFSLRLFLSSWLCLCFTQDEDNVIVLSAKRQREGSEGRNGEDGIENQRILMVPKISNKTSQGAEE